MTEGKHWIILKIDMMLNELDTEYYISIMK